MLHLTDLNPHIIHYLCPQTVDEALDIRELYGHKACWAGGWALAGRDVDSPVICAIALDHIRIHGASLNIIQKDDHTLRVGALTTLQDMMDHPDIPPVLKEAARLEPSRALRCTMTLGGDVAARRPDSHLATTLMALGALLELAGDSAVSVNQYAARHERDLILFARMPLNRRAAVARHRRSARGAVLLTVAVGWDQDGNDAVVAVAGTGLPLQRLPEIEQLLDIHGETLPLSVLEKAVRTTLHPEADWTGSTAYKAHLTAVAVADCVAACRQGRVTC